VRDHSTDSGDFSSQREFKLLSSVKKIHVKPLNESGNSN